MDEGGTCQQVLVRARIRQLVASQGLVSSYPA